MYLHDFMEFSRFGLDRDARRFSEIVAPPKLMSQFGLVAVSMKGEQLDFINAIFIVCFIGYKPDF